MRNSKAVIVFSGGQDSTTCLGWALNNFKEVICLGFNYGQQHAIELECARNICDEVNVPFELLDINLLNQIGDSALLSSNDDDVNGAHQHGNGLPASFVPNRNAMFLTAAHAYAQKVGANVVVTGVCETDYSGYPDCRSNFITALEEVLNLGSGACISIVTPLMYLNKAQTFQLAEDNDFLDEVVNLSHTCYNGKRNGEFYHKWGHGCGECPACKLRAKGWEEFVNGETTNI